MSLCNIVPVLLLLGLIACVDSSDPFDADVEAAALIRPPHAKAPLLGLPEGAACQPTLDQCAAWLTCRMTGAHIGYCTPPGPQSAGAVCTTSADCGYATHCAQSSTGVARCYTICETQPVVGRLCKPGTVCTPYVGETGLCGL